MFECRACLFRCLSAIAADLRPALHSYPIQRFRRASAWQQQRRKLGTVGATRKKSGIVTFDTFKGNAKYGPFTHLPKAVPMGLSSGQSTGSPPIKTRHINKELQYLSSPMRVADRVRDVLRKGNDEKAFALLQAASKSMSCIVGWNHLLDFHMSQERVKVALKIYNDMKKRAQRPDSYTYLIMLRGFALNATNRLSVNEAVKLYHSMNAPNSQIKPAIIHTNAVLNVAARAGDMDALWSVAGQIPERGQGAADYTTYTTILNALRHYTLTKGPEDVDAAQRAAVLSSALNDGRRIWMEIIQRWREGVLFIDESLVCAMGRLLLIGTTERDWDDVFSLVEQTMKIRRVTPRLGSGLDSTPALPGGIDSEPMPTDLEAHSQRLEGNEFRTVELPEKSSSHKKSRTAYVKPSNNTLSIILEACTKLDTKRTAREYWNMLTARTSFGIIPDTANCNLLLRQLRRSRASSEALEIVRAQANSPPVHPATFRIAMSTCVRDKKNINVLNIASALLDLMRSSLLNPDIKTLTLYLRLVQSMEEPKDMIRALERVGPDMLNIKNYLLPRKPSGENHSSIVEEEREAAVELAQNMIACCDRLCSHNELPADKREYYQRQRSKLTSFIGRSARSDSERGEAEQASSKAKDEEEDDELEGTVRDKMVIRSEQGRNSIMKGGKPRTLPEIQLRRADDRKKRRMKEKEARSKAEFGRHNVQQLERMEATASIVDGDFGVSPAFVPR